MLRFSVIPAKAGTQKHHGMANEAGARLIVVLLPGKTNKPTLTERSWTKDGTLTLRLQGKYQPGVNWRQQPRLAEAWLIKQP